MLIFFSRFQRISLETNKVSFQGKPVLITIGPLMIFNVVDNTEMESPLAAAIASKKLVKVKM